MPGRKRKLSDHEVAQEVLQGATLFKDPSSSAVVSLSTRDCLDSDRWHTMPSLDAFATIQTLDLYKNRYITSIEPIMALSQLKSLSLTRCSALRTLPEEIGKLQHLEVVSTVRNQ